MTVNQEKNWDNRAEHYDKLFWTKDDDYLKAIFEVCQFKKTDIVLDAGVGTGAIAKEISKITNSIIGVDISSMMLSQGKWNGVSMVKWDIRNELFADEIFDTVIARMVFHHLVKGLDIATLRCWATLKYGGKIVIAEGLPPSDDKQVVGWYKNMFKLKEERLTFMPDELNRLLDRCYFKSIQQKIYTMHKFSIRNWLENSGLPSDKQKMIMDLHCNAPSFVQDAYNLEITNDDCLVDTRNIIISAYKEKG